MANNEQYFNITLLHMNRLSKTDSLAFVSLIYSLLSADLLPKFVQKKSVVTRAHNWISLTLAIMVYMGYKKMLIPY